MGLSKFTSNLYRLSGNLNLYIRLASQNSKPDINRVKEELETIKQLIAEMETEVEGL